MVTLLPFSFLFAAFMFQSYLLVKGKDLGILSILFYTIYCVVTVGAILLAKELHFSLFGKYLVSYNETELCVKTITCFGHRTQTFLWQNINAIIIKQVYGKRTSFDWIAVEVSSKIVPLIKGLSIENANALISKLAEIKSQ